MKVDKDTEIHARILLLGAPIRLRRTLNQWHSQPPAHLAFGNALAFVVVFVYPFWVYKLMIYIFIISLKFEV